MNIRIQFDGVYLANHLNDPEGKWLIDEFENFLNGRANDLPYYLFNVMLADLDFIDDDENSDWAHSSVYFTDLVPDDVREKGEQMVYDFYKSGAWKKA